ncbi:MAG: nucleoside hydrolase [Treponema sp.]|nr:nucleoside hydrolase [Treponema sp.]
MKKIPIVIDVDTGTDDAIAVMAALLSQDTLDIKAFTTVAGNVSLEKTSKNTLNLVDYLGYDIKVAVGASKPLAKDAFHATCHGNSGLGDVVLPESKRGFYEKDAVTTLYEEAIKANGELQVLAVGPLTNLAMAITCYPEISEKIKRLTIMGGGVFGGNVTMTSEFNIYFDPEAAKIVFESGIPLYMVGLDVTTKTSLPPDVFSAIKNSGSKYASAAAKIFDFMVRRNVESGGEAPFLHDVIALAAVINPDILTFKKFYMEVECEGTITRGMTVADLNNVKEKDPNISAALEIDSENFWRWLRELFLSSV